MDNLANKFMHTMNLYPQNMALWVDGKGYTYTQLYQLARKLANAMGKSSSSQCVIFSEKNLIAYVAILACVLAGKAYVFLNPKLPCNRNKYIFEDSEAEILIADQNDNKTLLALSYEHKKILLILLPDHTVNPLPINRRYIVMLKNDIANTNPTEDLPTNPNAYLMYTSGSTGLAKGVMITQKNCLQYLDNVIARAKPNSDDKFTQLTELSFDLSVHDIFVCWSVGACLYPIREREFINLFDFINKQKLTFWLSAPSMIHLIRGMNKQEKSLLMTLRYSIFCGEPLTEKIAQNWNKLAPNSSIDNFYGPTEATIAITAFRWDPRSRLNPAIVPIGKPFANQKLLLVDNDLQLVSHGCGEIILAGTQVATGYWNNPIQTNRAFIDLDLSDFVENKWYRTGDHASRNHKGEYLFKGRIDDQLQIKGCRVEKLEIETVLKKISKTDLVAVVPKYHLDEIIVIGVIAFIAKSNFDKKYILHKCIACLPKYLIPLDIILMEDLPRTVHGKINYQQLNNKVLSSG